MSVTLPLYDVVPEAPHAAGRAAPDAVYANWRQAMIRRRSSSTVTARAGILALALALAALPAMAAHAGKLALFRPVARSATLA